ncbi:alpha-amylase family protein [Actinopolymorpha alba]|uniref:alpha-amylase family protein n=1 Tax=Actinopolymorpha alba TaxID=533267 RepID=UPI00146F706F|nr:alpha-amylase family protein [Actinopolymorpha alba]
MSGAQDEPWYWRTLRWGQTNLTEIDPARYDAAWWRDYWRRTSVQGVIVNAGGIVAYYPSEHPLHRRAEFLGDRDLYGEIVKAAREEGLSVLARMDSNRADETFYLEHPDWFAVDADGQPFKAGNLYLACVNGPYYREYLPAVLAEIVRRSSPDGITDNSWSGLGRDHICYCVSCRRGFRESTGQDLPRRRDWDDPAYRQWIEWSYAQRLGIWDLNNAVTSRVGGEDCLWIGMNAGDPLAQSLHFRDYKAICERASIIMLDSQFRRGAGFSANGDSGKLVHGLLGWDALIPESTAMYDAGIPTFRLGSKPEAETRMWAVEGFAGGLQPWWHHIGSHHEDRRQYHTARPLFRWHEANCTYLQDRDPIATVGVVWSQRSLDFHGRDEPQERSVDPYRGVVDALIRARIPYLPVHADHIERDADQFEVLVLPNVGALSDRQCAQIRSFVYDGGGLVATGESSLYDEWGDRRPDFALADLLGVHATGSHHGSFAPSTPDWQAYDGHTYLRIERSEKLPEEIVAGFTETDLLPFGGRLEVVRADEDATVAMTWVPPFPIYPPEKAWMARTHSGLPGLVTRVRSNGSRIAYLGADLDRRYARHHHPDHGRVLANAVRWAACGWVALEVDGPGVLDCHLYRQGDSVILHLVNLNQGGAWQGALDELVPAGPFAVRVRMPGERVANRARLLVAERDAQVRDEDGWSSVVVPRVVDHEVIVLSA